MDLNHFWISFREKVGNIVLRFLVKLWPKSVALVNSLFLGLTCAHNHRYIILPYHLPKMLCRLRQWTLASYYLSFSHGRIHEAGIDVIGFWHLLKIDSFNELDSCVFIGENMVPVPVFINLVIQKLLFDCLIHVLKLV